MIIIKNRNISKGPKPNNKSVQKATGADFVWLFQGLYCNNIFTTIKFETLY